jgi:hypothetical protein
MVNIVELWHQRPYEFRRRHDLARVTAGMLGGVKHTAADGRW